MTGAASGMATDLVRPTGYMILIALSNLHAAAFSRGNASVRLVLVAAVQRHVSRHAHVVEHVANSDTPTDDNHTDVLPDWLGTRALDVADTLGRRF